MPSFHSDQSLTALANCSKRKMPTCDILYFCSPESHSVILAVINPLFGPLWYWWMMCCVGLCRYGNIGASTRVPQQHFITSSGHQWDLHFFCKPFVTLCASVGKSCRVRASCFGFTLQVLCSWDFWTPWLRAAKMEENISAPDFGMSNGAIPMICRQRKLCHRAPWQTIQICLQKPTDTVKEIGAAFLTSQEWWCYFLSKLWKRSNWYVRGSWTLDCHNLSLTWAALCLSYILLIFVTSIYEEFTPSSGDTVLRRLRLWPTQQGRHWANQGQVSWQGLVLQGSAS